MMMALIDSELYKYGQDGGSLVEHYLQMGGHHNQEEEADLDASTPPAGSSKLHSQSHHACILGASARADVGR